jgi:hypothetical protein
MRACSYCNIYNNDIYRCNSYVTYDDLSKFTITSVAVPEALIAGTSIPAVVVLSTRDVLDVV